MKDKPLKIVYVTPALYMAGGVERVLSLKANYFADHFGYDITIILTEGKDKPLFYPLSEKIKIVNLDINFEELWDCSLVKKVFVYLRKQWRFRRLLRDELMRQRSDITVSMMRREINFITDIKDGSRKIAELHVPREYYRHLGNNFVMRRISAKWMNKLIKKLQRLDAFVVLTESARKSWPELEQVVMIPNPISFMPPTVDYPREKRVIAVGRYSEEKGYDMLLQAWSMIQNACPDWRLEVFGDGEHGPYERMMHELHIDKSRCLLHGRTSHIAEEYSKSMLAVCSSRFEGFGMMILEAMACGLPVVSFDCPWGPRSMITDGIDGILVENGNVVRLATALRRLMSNEQLLQAYAMEAKTNAPWYDLDYVTQMWKSLFEQVVSGDQLSPVVPQT